MPEPQLPIPHGWSFPDDFSRTSGTGRLIGGAFEWTDWVYDAYGAASPQAPPNSITQGADSLSPAKGSYIYPAGPASADGADIFRAAVGATRTTTVWRVDWNTMVDPSVPIAEWTFDTDSNAATGASSWPANANVSSPGIELALVVSAKGARLINAVTGDSIATYPTTVDRPARSFVVSIPRSVLPVGGTWRVRLAAGLADASGSAFAIPTLSGGTQAGSTAPRVYNVTFRTSAQEPPHYPPPSNGPTPAPVDNLLAANFWGETDQAETLAGGDVSKFSQLIDWHQLESAQQTNPPLLHGWSDRWYVSGLSLGDGVASTPSANPAFLSRVQPYEVYVPSDYAVSRTFPLTWTLHSASVNYNQYPVVNPRLAQQVCEDRHSICASPEGFGGGGLYAGIAEQDFWQVWRQVALNFNIDTTRTVVTGYSMGGLASFVLPATYPSIFSEAMPLDGGFDDGCSTAPSGGANFAIAYAADRSRNVHWIPQVISDSYTDELSPYPNNAELVRRLQAAGDRFTLFSTTTPEHITTDAADGFSTQVATLHGTPTAKTSPGTIDYTWCPNVVDPTLGLGPTQVYWLSGLAQRSSSSGTTSHLVASDRAISEPTETEQLNASAVSPPDAPPMQVLTGTWTPGPESSVEPKLDLTLSNVASLTVDTAAARLPAGTATTVSDGTVVLTLSRLRPGTLVELPDRAIHAGQTGAVTFTAPSGTSKVSWMPGADGDVLARTSASTSLPDTATGEAGLLPPVFASGAVGITGIAAARRRRKSPGRPSWGRS